MEIAKYQLKIDPIIFRKIPNMPKSSFVIILQVKLLPIWECSHVDFSVNDKKKKKEKTEQNKKSNYMLG